MQRLAIAREDPAIRQAIPQSSFRSQQQAMAEAQMMRAAILAKSHQQQQQQQSGAGAAAGGAQAAAAAPAVAARTMALPSGGGGGGARPFLNRVASSPAALPFVFRRAAQDVQITDPATQDILQLDRGTWVLTAAAADPSSGALTIYTTDADTGNVMAYQVPLPEGKITRVFDQSTLNPLDTVTIGE